MKKIAFSLVAVLLLSCNTSSKQESVIDVKSADLTYMTIRMDDGKVWKANKETTESITTMLNYTIAFDGDYALLKMNLEKEFQNMFLKCTMTGEAHNQLHNYLAPMIEMFDGIGNSDKNMANQSIDKLKIHLSAYSLFFE